MAGVFDSDIQTAQELIAENGEVSTLRRVIPGEQDPNAPWKPVEPQEIDTPVRAVWLNYSYQSSGQPYAAGSMIKVGDKKVLIAAAEAQEITASDYLIRADGRVYKVANPKLLDPNGQRILWTVQAEQ